MARVTLQLEITIPDELEDGMEPEDFINDVMMAVTEAIEDCNAGSVVSVGDYESQLGD
jgi:hypothetical protein